MDLNEKLKMFGVSHGIGRDGYSGMIVAFSTMPVTKTLLFMMKYMAILQ